MFANIPRRGRAGGSTGKLREPAVYRATQGIAAAVVTLVNILLQFGHLRQIAARLELDFAAGGLPQAGQ
ncbi:MAG: hypothetical protein KKI09_13505, partial [Spirochaetes bacterium]|nr:hypothetical protein [Spirochaetota bacterium]